jgi:hypothetical protein
MTWRMRALLVLILVALPSAAALAYWSGTGTGTASVTLPNPLALSVSAGVPSYPLSPGETGSVNVIVSNPNTIQEHIGSFTADFDSGDPITVDSAHSGCDVSALSFITQTNGGVGWNVPSKVGASDGTLTVDLAHALTMSDAAANACQGASFAVPLDVTP